MPKYTILSIGSDIIESSTFGRQDFAHIKIQILGTVECSNRKDAIATMQTQLDNDGKVFYGEVLVIRGSFKTFERDYMHTKNYKQNKKV